MTEIEKKKILNLYKDILLSHTNINNIKERDLPDYFEFLERSNNGKFASVKEIEPIYYDTEYFYELNFKNLLDLYEYLKCEPLLNSKVFGHELASQKATNSFNEMDYQQAVNYLKGGYKANLTELLSLKTKLNKELEFPSTRRKVIKSVTGSRINPNSFIANDPKRYYKLERIAEREFITIHLNMAYYHGITKAQILNRGVLLLSLIDILEENNCSVKLNSFFLMNEGNEYMYIKINLKDINDYINAKRVLFPFTSPAFFRRCIFRVMESVPVKKDWGCGYGTTVTDKIAKELLNLSKDDIYIGPPDTANIRGIMLNEDAENFLKYIDMDKYVKVRIKK